MPASRCRGARLPLALLLHGCARFGAAQSTTFGFDTATSPGWSTGGGDPPWAFTRQNGATPSADTGPSAGPAGGSGWYYFAETSGRQLNDLYTLAYDGTACSSIGSVAWQYHMSGRNMGSLSLVDAGGTTLWTRSGDQGSSWLQADVSFFSSAFQFQYLRGNGFRGDASVAQVVVTCGVAPPSPPRPPPRPPSPPPKPPSPPLPPGSVYASQDSIRIAAGASYSQLHTWLADSNGPTRIVFPPGNYALRGLVAVETTREPSELAACDHMLLCLNGLTWTSGAASEALAGEVARAMRCGVNVLLVHEMPGVGQEGRHAVEFASFFSCDDGATPAHLLKAGIYAAIAVPLKGGPWRAASMALLQKAITSSPPAPTPAEALAPASRNPAEGKFASALTPPTDGTTPQGGRRIGLLARARSTLRPNATPLVIAGKAEPRARRPTGISAETGLPVSPHMRSSQRQRDDALVVRSSKLNYASI